MRVSVIGTGYLGAVHATAMASQGFDVVGVDTDPKKIEMLAAGLAPFYEPGFNDFLAQVGSSGRLRWTTDFSEAGTAGIHFICVGTPQQVGGRAADMTHVWGAVESLLPFLADGSVVVGKSTVPVGSAAEIAGYIAAKWSGDLGSCPAVAWNPEFLREGYAVQDSLRPDRIVVGVTEDESGRQADAALREVYAEQLEAGIPFLTMDRYTAELVKVAANAFLATKISFINAMAEVCEVAGADVVSLADAIGHDERIGRKFLAAGVGFGGGCLPKDLRAFATRAGELGVGQALAFLDEVDGINTRRRDRAIDTARALLSGGFRDQRVVVLGAAFKPNSDDVRDSPALEVAARIHHEGGDVVVHDPKALANAEARFPALSYERDLGAALSGANVLLLLTEWQEYRDLDPSTVGALVTERNILDGRNVLDVDAWRRAGWTVRGMGRAHA